VARTWAADTEANKDSGARKGAAIFGAARPREEVLKQRGVEPSGLGDLDRPAPPPAAPPSGSRPSSRAASVASGASEEDAWHTVCSKKAAAKLAAGAGPAPDVYSGADDVFFCGRSGLGPAPAHRMAGRSYENESTLSGVYGSPYGYGSAGLAGDVGDDAPVFRRALPVRAGQVF
jgi:hypothetical protein